MLQNFSKAFVYNGVEYWQKETLGNFLANKFHTAIELLKDGTLWNFLEKEDNPLYVQLIEYTKDFIYEENVLTLILYFLDNSIGIKTAKYSFKSNYDIAEYMKKIYPEVDGNIKMLFADKILAYIFWNEYVKTNDSRYKRNYTFMLQIYENHNFDFTYYYYLFLHLDKNETIRFTLDGVKMKSIGEITAHLSANISRASSIIDEILGNSFIMALIAVSSGIDVVGGILKKKNKYEILKTLSDYSQEDLTPIICQNIAFWLLYNYKMYSYDTPEAQELFSEYTIASHSIKLNTISDYVLAYEHVRELYKIFLTLFDFNQICSFQKGISCSNEYYLGFRYNDDLVCQRFLLDNKVFDLKVYTQKASLDAEKEMLVNVLEKDKQANIELKNNILVVKEKLNYNKRKNTIYKLNSIIGMILVIMSLLYSFFGKCFNTDNFYNEIINVFLLVSLSISTIVFLHFFFQSCINCYQDEMINNSLSASDMAYRKLTEEQRNIVNDQEEYYDSLHYRKKYEENRNKDYKKISRFKAVNMDKKKPFLYVAFASLALPLFEFSLCFYSHIYGSKFFYLGFSQVHFNFISLIFTIIYYVANISLGKKRISYYVIFICMVLCPLTSYLLGLVI